MPDLFGFAPKFVGAGGEGWCLSTTFLCHPKEDPLQALDTQHEPLD